MIYQAIHERIEAEPVVVKSTGQEMFWCKEAGALVAGDAFATLYRAEKVERIPKPAAKKRAAPKPASRRWNSGPLSQPNSPKNVENRVVSPEGETQGAILAILKRTPKTSGELISETGRTAPAVYTALTALRKVGLIHTQIREEDGAQANFYCGKQEAV